MKTTRLGTLFAATAGALLLSAPTLAQDQGRPNVASPAQSPNRDANPDMVTNVKMVNEQGKTVGSVQLRQLTHGLVLIADLQGLPPGPHGFHIHERGVCEPPSFQSAGGHYSPLPSTHGFDSPKGFHVGDLPNIHVAEDGTARAEFHTRLLTLAPAAHARQDVGGPAPFSLLDQNGSAIMIHAKGDDYQASTPESTGPRIACGVIAPPA